MDLTIPDKDETEPSLCSESPNSIATSHHVCTEDFLVATILMVAYLMETFVQIYLIVDCYNSSSYFMVTSNWLWILLASWVFSSLFVTILSVVWTLRGMDFEGRLCGQLLCYIMHCLLLGFLWRYLKIALAFEKADAEEFFKLRTLQIYVQTLPIVVIHLVCILSPFQGYENLASWMVAGEVFSAIISLVLYSLLKPKVNLFCEVDSDKTPLSLETNVTSRILILISRVIAVGLFASVTSYWSLLAILVHLVICRTWIQIFVNDCTKTSKWSEMNDRKCLESDMRNEPDSVVSSPSMGLVTCTYILFWDMNSTIVGGLNLRCLSLPVFLVLVENVAIVIYHLHCQTTVYLTIASGLCLLCGSLFLFIGPTWNKLSSYVCYSNKTNIKETSQGLPVVDVSRDDKYENEQNARHINTTIPFYNNRDKDDSIRGKLGFWESHKNGNMKGSLQDTTNSSALQSIAVTNDYQRINETLMTTVNKVTSACHVGMTHCKVTKGLKLQASLNVAEQPMDILQPLQNEVPLTIYKNTWGSTSSRNTNTISDFASPDNLDRCSRQQQIVTSSVQESTENLRLKSKNVQIALNSQNVTNVMYHQSPLQIRKASKILLNNPKQQSLSESQVVNRCLCLRQDKCSEESENNIYEKLIEDAYGILICEGESTQRTERCIKHDSSHSTPIFYSGKKLKVLCAKCLENHDPLLTDCIEIEGTQNHLARPTDQQQKSCLFTPNAFESPCLSSETTEYPTDTEFTCNLHEGDELSISTHMSTVHSVTYTNLPIKYHFSHFITPKVVPIREIPKELTGLEYVRAWLMMNDLQIENYGRANTDLSNRSNRNRRRPSVSNTYSSYTQGKNQKRLVTTLRPRSTQGKIDKSSKYSYNPNNSYKNPAFLTKFQPPPKQKQHPSSLMNSVKLSNSIGTCNLEKPYNCKYTQPELYHIQSDLLETVV